MSTAADTAVDRYCVRCGYLLRGLTQNRCPECGFPFDPRNPSTYVSARPLFRVARWLMKPMGWPMHVAAMGCVLLFLLSSSIPGGHFDLLIYSVGAWLLYGVGWLFRAIAGVLIRDRFGLSTAEGGFLRNLLVTPVLFIVMVVLVATQVPLLVRFHLSLPAMERLVAAAGNAPPGSTFPNQWIGLYPAVSIRSYPGGVRFLVSGSSGFMESAGLAYMTGGQPPPRIESDTYTHFRDDWYIWTWTYDF